MPANAPSLPANAPKELVDFVACRTNSVTLKGGPQAWIGKVDLGVTEITPDVTFERDGPSGGITAVVGKGGLGVSMPVAVVDGHLTVDTSSLPGSVQADTDSWIKQFNEHLNAEGKHVGGITLNSGSLTITKVAVVAKVGPIKKAVVGGGVAVVATTALLGGLYFWGPNPRMPVPGATVTATPGASRASASAAGARPWEMKPIVAEFRGGSFATDYTVEVNGVPAGAKWTTSWSMQLTLVDPAGAPDPGEPGSKAAVDLDCNNAGGGIPTPETGTLGSARDVPVYTTFRWTHPSPPDSIPAGLYHCEHLDQGPHGHQGLITVTVSDANWTCVAQYRGTHSGKGSDAGQAGPVQCTSRAAPSPTP